MLQLKLLKTLVFWALADSESIQTILKHSYNFSRQNDDRNVGLAVIPWFTDTFSKRKYYLVEGREDTHFRLYRENNAISTKTNTWFSVAGDIEEVRSIADKFDAEAASQSKVIAGKIRSALPRFEAGEEVSCVLRSLCTQLTKCRKESVVTTGYRAKQHSQDPNQAFQCTKAGLEENG